MLFMGVQEARHKFDAFLDFPGTDFITTAADSGSYGCALLVNKKVPYGSNDGKGLFLCVIISLFQLRSPANSLSTLTPRIFRVLSLSPMPPVTIPRICGTSKLLKL